MKLLAAVEGSGGHQFIYVWYMTARLKQSIKQTNSNTKTIPRAGSSCLKPGLDHEFWENQI